MKTLLKTTPIILSISLAILAHIIYKDNQSAAIAFGYASAMAGILILIIWRKK
jgi:predicted Zn-dependent protease